MSSPAVQLPLEQPNRRLLAPLVSNWWIPLVLGVFILIGRWIEGGQTFLHIRFDNFWRQIIWIIGINITLAISLQLINGIAGQFSLGHAGFMAVGAYIGGYAVSAHGTRINADEETLQWVHPGGVLLFTLSILVVTFVASAVFYGLYRLVRLTTRLHPKAPTLFLALIGLWFVIDIIVQKKVPGESEPAHLLGALKLAGTILSVITGSHEWLMTHGAKFADFVTNHTPTSLLRPFCLILSLLGGGAMAAIVGFVVGLPTLRLRGDYLAIATLGVSELIRTAITNSEPLGRASGLAAPTYPQDADPSVGLGQIYYFPWIYGVALFAFIVVWRVQHSPKGRALQCLREDEIAAGAVGINVTTHKVLAFVVGAFLAGMAGSLFAHYLGYINPKQFDMSKSIEIVVMVTLGGLGSVPGAIIAAILLSLLQPALQTANQWLPASTPKFILDGSEYANKYRLVIYALLLILAMLARSRGWLTLGRRKSAGSLASAV